MSIQDLGSIGELIAAIATVATLLYLATQIRQNTKSVQANVRQAMLADDLDLIRMQLDYPILITGRSGGADLSDEDVARLHSNILGVICTRENQWLQYQNGVLDERSWHTYHAAITSVLSTEFMRSWWTNRAPRGEFDEDFVAAVDKLLCETPPRPAESVRESVGFDPL